MDFKEADASAAPSSSRDMPSDHAKRSLKGHDTSHLSWGRMQATSQLGHSVFIRGFAPGPQTRVDPMDSQGGSEGGGIPRCGRWHGRCAQMDSSTRIAWQDELQRHRPRDLIAPLWLGTTRRRALDRPRALLP